MSAVLWAVWALACLLIAWGCLRATRDYRDDEPQPGPAWDADAQQRRHDAWAAAWEHRYNLPAYDPNHHTTKGDQ